ncbi:hypothetical protein GA0115261_1090810, partial [Streptomyces sp. OspMP-M43]
AHPAAMLRRPPDEMREAAYAGATAEEG